jgi:hypothetical protein
MRPPGLLEGLALEGLALDGAALDGAALEGGTLEGAALEGLALDGSTLVGWSPRMRAGRGSTALGPAAPDGSVPGVAATVGVVCSCVGTCVGISTPSNCSMG